jgi:low temperature requirement protein LtrA
MLGLSKELIDGYGYGFLGFGKFYLTFIPLLYRWRAETILKNQFHDNSLVRKLFDVMIIGIVVLMAVQFEHSFDKDHKKNTSSLFLGLHLTSGVLVEVYQFLAACISDRRFLKSVYLKTLVASVFLPSVYNHSSLFPLQWIDRKREC